MAKVDPNVLSLADVPRYMRIKHCTDVTRQTVYNWATKGVHGTKLKFLPGLKRRTTRKEWVDAFASHLMSVRQIGTD